MRTIHKSALLGSAAMLTLLAFAPAAWAQTAPAPQEEEAASSLDDVVVVGSQIRGAAVNAALPVTVLNEEQILATGSVSGDDLMRSIPQMGDVLFSAANNPQTSNAARGDVNSVNLRSLGVGNTLVLLNGRRIITHPTSQGTSDTGTVPVLSYNSNAIPVSGTGRVEVLLDGAAAIYGADAVAGVVNTVLRDNFDGFRVQTQYGGAEGTHLRELTTNIFAGRNFDRGNISGFLDYTDRTALLASDQDFTSSSNLRSLFANEPGFETSLDPDGRATRGAWANLQAQTSTTIRRNGTALTTSAGTFHIQPASFGCATPIGTDICIATGNASANGIQRDLRYDTQVGTTVTPEVERLNLFVTGRYDLTDDVEAFGEIGFYQATTQNIQPPTISLNAIWIPASNYWNPFGPVTFANGQANPNRLSGLTGVPVGGLNVRLGNYRFNDAGFQIVDVENYQSRILGGLRGERWGFDWETALVYSEAEATDTSNAVNMTALQASLALSTPDAYNPFNGGCVATTTFGDCTPSSQVAIDAISTELVRVSRTTLTMADFKMSRPDLMELPAGPLGVAFGLEFRHETQSDDRDADLDGTNVFTDMIDGTISVSNLSAVSSNPDTEGERDVASAYVEFAVPVISPEMNIPLIHNLEFQVAGRAEHYSDFGSVAKPKIAMALDIVEGLRLRASYSEGFRAPNLEQTNATTYSRLASNNDYLRCEADLRAGRIATFTACAQSVSYSLRVSGNPDLKPEESTNQSVGLVFEPWFLPEALGDFTFTVDRWRIQQEDIVGLIGGQTAVVQDYLARLNGSSNPNVVRAAPNVDDIAFFTGTGIAPVGAIQFVSDGFVNLLPQDVQGVDFAVHWRLRDTPWGDFRAQVNVAQLLEFHRDAGPTVQALDDARDAGQINPSTPLPIASDLLARNGRPEFKVSSTLTWSQGPFQVGAFVQYTSAVDETGFLSTTGDAWVVESQTTANLYGQYEFEGAGWAADTRIRVGARNITDEAPPLTSSGYLGSLYRPYGRYWYASITKTF